MIGRLKHSDWTAEMQDSGAWTASDPHIEDILNAFYTAQHYSSPALGAYGFCAIQIAARDFKAEVTDLMEIPEDHPGTIY